MEIIEKINDKHVLLLLLRNGEEQNGYKILPSRLHIHSDNNLNNLCAPGRVAQSVTCLATDASLTANPGVASSIPTRSHNFVETDNEIISTVILLPSSESFRKGCCQLQVNVCARNTG